MNRLQKAIVKNQNRLILGAAAYMYNPAFLEMAALMGYTAAWIEMEHGPMTWADLSHASRVCDLWGVTSLVRVNSNEPAIISRTLDRGIQGVLIPHVNTKEQAERAVSGAYFAPAGKRGMFRQRFADGDEG